MKWTGLNELRSGFLSFFESKGHLVLPSAPLVPQDDNSLLLINSGMAPLKKYFTGQTVPPSKRATSCQKCIRTPDIERVGKTARHGTYFEMLGNFSFGDYFKEDATKWAWEYITEVVKLPVDRVWVSIYENDDQAFDIWTKQVGVSPDKIVRLGKADNFWEIGSGPCGPCSELYFDRGEQYGCGKNTCAVGCDCDRYVEFWNLVFTQFNSDGAGNYTPLEHPNIDTGMGLERIACIMQEVGNLFEVDTVAKIMEHICRIAGVSYKTSEKTDVSLRVITDHVRSTTMMIGDGVVPHNEGRGYVLRRLLRRAARHGRLLGINEPFLYKVCETVIEENKSAYPQLETNKDYIIKVIKVEEERFAKTIDQGMELLSNMIEQLSRNAGTVLSGEQAFRLYDTFGFPIDLTREILEERAMSVNEDEFTQLMREQRERARAARTALGDVSWEEDVLAAMAEGTDFVGYSQIMSQAKVKALLVDNAVAEMISEGDKAAIVLDTTPFYAEGGGQKGDIGTITVGPAVFEVYDCRKSASGKYLHIGEMKRGSISAGDIVTAAVNVTNRADITRNHTACHLLQQALREVLGSHVHQSGSMVDNNVCRFDFSHFSPVTSEELARVEDIVNGMIFDAMDATASYMGINEAREMGAMALFSEKYGDTVRVMNIGGRSIELCGGVHVSNTAQIGTFKIIKESSVAAGIRRIEAVTGRGVLKHLSELEAQIGAVADALKISANSDVVAKVNALVAESREKDRSITQLSQKIAAAQVNELLAAAKEIKGIKLITASFNGTSPDALRTLGDQIKDASGNAAAVLISTNADKVSILAVCGKEAVGAGLHAGKLVKEITSLVGGSGGGRPDSAMGGINDKAKINEALSQSVTIIESMFTK